MKALIGGTLVSNGAVIRDGIVLGDGPTIIAAGPRGAVSIPARAERIDVAGAYVCPGFIDVHVHGGGGADFMDGTVAAIRDVARFHATGGTTALLATTAAAPRGEYEHVLAVIGQVIRLRRTGGATVLGVHMEGPYFAPSKRGCHPAAHVRPPDPDECAALLTNSTPIRWMTIAPELPRAEEVIRLLRAHGIVAAAGHSEATETEIDAAVAVGLSHATHLYCAMSAVVKEGPRRVPGLVETALARETMTIELIADGVHLPPTLLRLAWRAKGTAGTLLVTDAMRAAGMPDGTYTFGGSDGATAIVEGGIARTPDNTGYASSTARMSDLVRVMVQQVGCPLPQAVEMASANPAAALGLARRKGTLAAGADADIVVLSPDLTVQCTIVSGETVYRRNS